MKKTIFLFAFMTVLFSCSTSNTQDTPQNPEIGEVENTSSDWSIPVDEVLDGGPGRDGIPALENPVMDSADNFTILGDEDLVIGYKNGNDVRAYQHIILDWHEIVNDDIGDVSLAITYCPLTGTGIGWNRVVDGNKTTFGVSGLLYQTNLIPFDRATKSNWSQLLNESVNGSLSGNKAEVITLVETNWGTWKTMFPNTKRMSLDTGFARTYGVYPYVDYRTNNSFFLFPTPKDSRLPLKERVHSIVDDGDAKVYRFSDFASSNIIMDTFKGKNYIVVGNSNFIASFELDTSQNNLDFTYVYDGTSSAVFQDNLGTQYNLFGEAVTGSGQLKTSISFMGYWFSIPAFYETEIYGS